jgi:hypothetical protein
VSKLLTVDLSLGFHASDNIIRLARVFKALQACRLSLEEYYEQVETLTSPRLSCLFPSPTLVDPSKTLPTLTYRQFFSRAGEPDKFIVDLGNTYTSMYIATLGDTDHEVIVKFTARYNEAAHRILADAQLAPALHFCERVIGNLYMVVMDRVIGRTVWQLQQKMEIVPPIVLQRVTDAVSLLHANNIVFGDLRDPNIVYADNDHVVLVDFDWPGTDGESKYPASLNDDNEWARDVRAHGIMLKAHDLWQLQRLRKLIGQK